MEAAWQDQDDTNLKVDLKTKKLTGTQYTQKLREDYLKYHHTSWVTAETKPSSISALLSSNKPILSDKTPHLPPNTLSISQLPHPNSASFSSSCVTSISFHCGKLLVGGRDKRVRVFDLHNKNELVATAYMKDLPVENAHFLHDKILITGPRPFFYCFNLSSKDLARIPYVHDHQKQRILNSSVSPDKAHVCFMGENGVVLILSTISWQLVQKFKMNTEAKACCWLDSSTLATGGDEAEVYIWDIQLGRCMRRFWDDGNVKVTCLAAQGNWLATGSSTGVVNLYDTKNAEFQEVNPKPVKAVMNLTTSVEKLSFNQTGELLCMSSKWKRDGLKLLHTPSLTVFSNFPSFRDHLKYPFCSSFSEDSQLLAIGNDEGIALLYKLNHYCK